ncbi:hypothetical protein [Oribacterium sp. P9]|uniref:hypothetical protein n=1 Tax=Oribacterium sp. P9 TaxID=3378068 RepID=UPI0039672F9C
MLGTIAEYVAELGLDVAKNCGERKIEEHKLRADLTTFIESQRKYADMCSLAEEIDFQGLIDYISHHLLKDVSTRVFSPNSKMRGDARKMIIDRAITYSGADTPERKQKVADVIAISLDIIRDFYHKQCSMKDYIIASEAVEAVTEVVNESTNTTVATINDKTNLILDKITESRSLFSLDEAEKYAEEGRINDIGRKLNKFLDYISVKHPYYPDFKIDYAHGNLISAPVTPEAAKRFPPSMTFTGAVRFGNEYYNDPNGNPLVYAYRHQLPMIMEVKMVKKYLGEKPDPFQDDVAGLAGKTMIAKPPAFPPAFPCSIKVGTEVFFDYVLLRTQEIEDDGTYVIGNKEQNGYLYFEIRINPNKPSQPDFNIKIEKGSNKDRLKYVKFMNTLSKEKDLHIYLLDEGEDFLAGYINDFELHTGFASVDEEIDYLERVCTIEDFFDVKFPSEGGVSIADFDKIVRISDLIRKDQIEGTWTQATFTGITTQHFREELKSLENTEVHNLSFVWVDHVELFGVELEFRVLRSFISARIMDYDRVKKKVELLDDGESIKITFCASDDNRAIETLKIPEKFEKVS